MEDGTNEDQHLQASQRHHRDSIPALPYEEQRDWCFSWRKQTSHLALSNQQDSVVQKTLIGSIPFGGEGKKARHDKRRGTF
jgi:hypothetical protein